LNKKIFSVNFSAKITANSDRQGDFTMNGKLSSEHLLNIIYNAFKLVPDPEDKPSRRIKLIDCLMSGYALFSLKYPSLLQFDGSCQVEITKHNLEKLYKVNRAPSDTYMRERLDEIDPKKYLRKSFKRLLSRLQRSSYLKLFEFYKGRYLVALDGTGYFQSDDIHCENCCEKNHRDGRKSYYHQILTGALLHPDHKVVLPFAPEPIMKSDGMKKNDCERRAAERFLDDFRREHPHMKVIITGDGLFSNGPFIKRLKEDNHRFILVAKEADHKYLFEEFRGLAKEAYTMRRENTEHRFKYMNGLPLNDSHLDCLVNVLEYWEISKKGKTQHWVWITDIHLSKETVYQVMRGGRARWKIENETFNTLKNQGYHFEHNFGHGRKYLSTVMAYLVNLAFFVDQLRQLCCKAFKKALVRLKRKRNIWDQQRMLFLTYFVDDWETFVGALAQGHKGSKLLLDTS
jgi:hypothetical protein